MIFELLKYEVNPNDGCISLEFQAFNSPKIHKALCPTPQGAQAIMKSNARTALLLAVEKWIINKKEIIKNGADKHNLKKMNQLAEATRLQDQQEQRMELISIARSYINKELVLRAILPHYSNNQRISEEERLEEILGFCRRIISKHQQAAQKAA
jgi:hypothetical protein